MNALELRARAVAEVLRDHLPADVADDRARNLVQALADEPFLDMTSMSLLSRREIVRSALVHHWDIISDEASPALVTRVAQALADLRQT